MCVLALNSQREFLAPHSLLRREVAEENTFAWSAAPQQANLYSLIGTVRLCDCPAESLKEWPADSHSGVTGR
jgi:hypothetical protein